MAILIKILINLIYIYIYIFFFFLASEMTSEIGLVIWITINNY